MSAALSCMGRTQEEQGDGLNNFFLLPDLATKKKGGGEAQGIRDEDKTTRQIFPNFFFLETSNSLARTPGFEPGSLGGVGWPNPFHHCLFFPLCCLVFQFLQASHSYYLSVKGGGLHNISSSFSAPFYVILFPCTLERIRSVAG